MIYVSKKLLTRYEEVFLTFIKLILSLECIFVIMKIYAIPGLGTTEKLFVNTHIVNADLIALSWPIPDKQDTMQSYARKFLSQIDTSVPFCLLGVSFGGMLCAELAKLCTPQKIILVSSCKLRKELPWYLRIFKYIPLHKILSDKQHRFIAYEAKWFLGFGSAFVPEYLAMVNSMKKDYFKNSINIIVNWDAKDFSNKIIHIHGTNDRLLKHNIVKADYLIKGGTHAMIIFNAKEINKIIEQEITNVLQ